MDGHTVVSDVTHTNIFMSEKQKNKKGKFYMLILNLYSSQCGDGYNLKPYQRGVIKR